MAYSYSIEHRFPNDPEGEHFMLVCNDDEMGSSDCASFATLQEAINARLAIWAGHWAAMCEREARTFGTQQWAESRGDDLGESPDF